MGTGFFQCLDASLQVLGISAINAEECKRLVGIGTDGASSSCNTVHFTVNHGIQRCLVAAFQCSEYF